MFKNKLWEPLFDAFGLTASPFALRQGVFFNDGEGDGGGGGEGGDGSGDGSGDGEGGSDGSGDGGGEGEGGSDAHWSAGLVTSFGEVDASTDEGKATAALIEKMAGVDSKDLAGMLKGEVPESYEVPKIEGVEIDAEALKPFFAFAKEGEFTQAQVDQLVKFDHERNDPTKVLEAVEAQFTAERTALMGEMGNEKYSQMMKQGEDALKAFADEKTLEFLKKNALDGAPEIIRLFAKVGAAVGEDYHHQSGDRGVVKEKDKPGQGDGNMAKRMYPNLK